MKITVLVALAAVCALPSIFAREPDLDSAEMWTGTWRASDGQSMTISFRGRTATITYTHGWAPDTGKMRGDGEILEVKGGAVAGSGISRSEGTLVLNAEHTSITLNEIDFNDDGSKKTFQKTFDRTGPRFSSPPSVTASRHAKAETAESSDDSIIGRWEFPMGQTYTFRADGTFSAPNIHGKWQDVGMDQTDASAKYHLYTFSQSGRLIEEPEVLTLIRGDREGHEYESGHLLRLGQQMRVKKLADKANDDFR